MRSLLLVAHGSRRTQSNDEVRALADKLVHRCGDTFPVIHCAFLELADPLIPDGLQMCIEDAATSITVLPYFLNTGRHVAKDIPDIIDDFKKTASVDIQIAPHLGASEMMLDFLASVTAQGH